MTEPYDFVEPLSDEKSERIINLVLLLRSSSRGFTKSEIFKRLPAYKSELNFESASMMFERDKAELIKAGIVIDVYQADAYTEDEFRYRINDEDALLPKIDLTDAEVSILSVVLQGWKRTVHHSDAIQAQLKLEGLGHNLTDEIPVLEMTGNQHLPVLLQAISQRKAVNFDYIKPNDSNSMNRRLHPWGVLLRGGQWFVYGYDLERSADRVFNLNRITSEVKAGGVSGAYEIPEDLNFGSLFQPHFNQSKTKITLKVAPGSGYRWRNLVPEIDQLTDDLVEIEVEIDNLNLELPLLAAAAPGVIVLAPKNVRDQVASLVLGKSK